MSKLEAHEETAGCHLLNVSHIRKSVSFIKDFMNSIYGMKEVIAFSLLCYAMCPVKVAINTDSFTSQMFISLTWKQAFVSSSRPSSGSTSSAQQLEKSESCSFSRSLSSSRSPLSLSSVME